MTTVRGATGLVFSFFVLVFGMLLSTPVQADPFSGRPENPYYGPDLFKKVHQGLKNRDLVIELRRILSTKHIRNKGQPDSIVSSCNRNARDCYWHEPIDYSSARKELLGKLHLSGSDPHYAVRDVYCEKDYTKEDFKSGAGPGPNKTPSETVLNVEHTWPQSRFSGGYDKATQKSDLHHLYPTDSKMNSARGNMKFGEVDKPSRALDCPIAKLGMVKGSSGDFFEPPTEHKGNVARALFYFSVRYAISIDADEEAFLRKWNKQDPPNAFESARNEAIMKIQGVRNPFVDYPDLADSIADF